MLRAVSHSLGGLDAAAELDVDRSAEDRAFFAAEKAALQTSFDEVFAADQHLAKHLTLTRQRLQARVLVGDAVLDRGVRSGKARMKLELKTSSVAEGADHVFPADISDIVDAERRVEPGLVLQVVARFPQVPDFPGKAALEADLTGRAKRQTDNFTGRDAGEVEEHTLDGILTQKIVRASDALYRLEKRLLERFPREKTYVRAFFLDVAPARKKRAEEPPAPGGDSGSPR
ncbi:MAG: hypothetical protein ABIV93_14475 [Byssovorax sp.]